MREETTNTYQQGIIDELNWTQDYTDEDKGYERYQRRERFEKFLYGANGLDFCGCGATEDSLQSIVDALEVAAAPSPSARSRALMWAFGVKHVSDNPLVQIVFYLLTAKGFIDHDDEADINESVLTPAGRAFLPLLKEYLGQ